MAARVINLTFHGIGDARPASAGEDRVWLDRARFERILDAAAEWPDGVRLTFDDGNRSDVEVALPALTRRGLRATFFVVAGRLGRPGYLDEHDLAALAGAGMGIGCHGMEHRRWRRLDPGTLAEEVSLSRQRLQAATGAPVAAAACPFGAYDRRALAALRRAGYTRVYTSDGGSAVAGAWLQPRTTVRCDDDPGLLRAIRSADRDPLRHLRRRATVTVKRWR
jgi:peptidoglycan/xylan/chitin deacetylase (PgdA/CDA1 family)